VTASPWLNSWTQTESTGFPLTTAEVVEDEQGLRSLRTEFRRWASHRQLPTTATESWIFADLGASDDMYVWGIAARGADNNLLGALVLVDDQIDGQRVTSLAGTDQGNRGVLTLDSPEVAEEVARRLAGVMLQRPVSSDLLLGPLAADDPTVHAFASALPGAQLLVVEPIPTIQRDSPDVRAYLSSNVRRTLRKAKNRIDKDGHSMTVHFTTDATEIGSVIPQLERVHRERDHAHGRPSDLDDDRGRRLWRIRLRELAVANSLELATLRIDGELAAHALGVTDHPSYRVLEGRFVTDWGRYAPGRLLEAHVLKRVLEDELFTTLDWMTSVAPEKLLAANSVDPMVMLHWHPTY
jgi:hypothetical protein